MHEIELLDGVASVSRGEWDALVGDASPFLEWDWLASLEHSKSVGSSSGWIPKPMVVREGPRLIAACPLYVKENSDGEFVFDWGWADAAQRAGIRYYPKLLVAVPFTPVAGARFLVAAREDRATWVQRLGAALREVCSQSDLSGVHINFTRREEAEQLSRDGYQVRVGFQYHWRNEGFDSFDDYLARFRSKRRNQIKRERREMKQNGIVIETLVGAAISDDLFETMFRFYLQNVQSHYYGRQYLTREFFELLCERFKHRLCFVVARQGSELIAGTINVVKNDVLYGRYWGAKRHLRYLHFNVCYYAAIEYCIEAGIQRFEPGAGGDYKFLRGFDARPTYSLHYLAEPRLADAVARFLAVERAQARDALDFLRERSVLKRATGDGGEAGGKRTRSTGGIP